MSTREGPALQHVIS